MAGYRRDETQRGEDLSYLTTSELRDVANAHLSEIAAEEEEERQNEINRQRDLQQYAKASRKTRLEGKAEMAAKAPKLRSAQDSDVLDRLRWDPVHKQSSYLVGYLERFEGIKEMPLDKWIGEETHEEWIPQHRIKYFKEARTGEVVWHRDERIDAIFGSGLGVSGAGGDRV